MGNSNRYDVFDNLVGLCATCHGAVHDGNIPRNELLAIAAERAMTTVGELKIVLLRLIAAPTPDWMKNCNPKQGDSREPARSHHRQMAPKTTTGIQLG